MIPRDHLIASIILAAICYPFFGINSALIIAGGFLIDIDHYFLYAIKHKDLSIKNAYNYFSSLKTLKNYQRQKQGLCIFHTAEFMLLLLLLSFSSILIAILLGGVVLHVMLDLIYDSQNRKELVRVHSLFFWLLKRDLRKARF